MVFFDLSSIKVMHQASSIGSKLLLPVWQSFIFNTLASSTRVVGVLIAFPDMCIIYNFLERHQNKWNIKIYTV